MRLGKQRLGKPLLCGINVHKYVVFHDLIGACILRCYDCVERRRMQLYCLDSAALEHVSVFNVRMCATVVNLMAKLAGAGTRA